MSAKYVEFVSCITPTIATKDVPNPYDFVIRSLIIDTQLIAVFLYNDPSSPTDVIVTISGIDYVLHPGDSGWLGQAQAQLNETFQGIGNLTYQSVGTYKLQFRAVYYSDDPEAIVDDTRDFTVVVTDVTPPVHHATVSGTVKGLFGVVLGAKVELVGEDVSTTTDSAGAFKLSNVPFGDYTLCVSRQFYTSQSKDITLDQEKTYTEDFTLNFSMLVVGGVAAGAIAGSVGIYAVVRSIGGRKS